MKIKESKLFKFGIYVTLSFIIFILTSFLGSINLQYKLAIGSLLYFLFIFYSMTYETVINKKIVFWIISSPPILVFLIINILDFKSTNNSFPSSLFIVLACIGSYLFVKSKIIFIPLFLFLIFICWISFGKTYYSNYLAFGTYTKLLNINKPNYKLYDSSSKSINIHYESKKIILDFWNSNCMPCYKLFPLIDSFNKILDTTKYKIYVVNVPLKGQKMESNFRLLNKFNYSFSKLYSENMDILDSLKIEFFPTTIVIENNKLIYKGDFESAVNSLK